MVAAPSLEATRTQTSPRATAQAVDGVGVMLDVGVSVGVAVAVAEGVVVAVAEGVSVGLEVKVV